MAPSTGNSSLDADREEVGRMLARVAIALFVVFVAVVIASSLPPRLLDPAWQLRFTGTLVNNGTIAVLGLVLMWLATILHPASGRLRARRDQISSLAVAAAIGYLLLIPLQTYAVWQGVSSANLGQRSQLRTANEKLGQLRKAVNEATSTADLQSRLQALRGPTLPAADLARPIALVRPQILAGLDSAETTVRQRLSGLPPDRLWQLVQESVRVLVSALAYALAFAAGAYLPGQPLSLFDGWAQALQNNKRRSEARTSGKGSSRRSLNSNADYLRELSRGDERRAGWEKGEEE
ncbi:MAG: hypothetical protein ACK55X_14310 [Synechococcaceae cyanobacterium]